MVLASEIRKLALIGNYLPRKCGIATFTSDLFHAVAGKFPSVDCTVVPVNDVEGGYDYPPEVSFEFSQQDIDSYRRAADFLNFSIADVACLQHEYGLYGGPAGRHILALLRDLRMPIVTTLHTVLREPTVEQRQVMLDLAEVSSRLVAMSERGRNFLIELYGVPDEKIDVIAHGIPDVPFVSPDTYKDQFGVDGKHVVLTFGCFPQARALNMRSRRCRKSSASFRIWSISCSGRRTPTWSASMGRAIGGASSGWPETWASPRMSSFTIVSSNARN